LTFENILLYPQETRITIKLNFVLFPIETQDIMLFLGYYGFLRTKLPPKPNLPVDTKLEMIGLIASKDDVSIELNPDTQTLSARGPIFYNVSKIFQEVIAIIEKHIYYDFEKNSFYIESISSNRIKTGNSPLSNIQKLGKLSIYNKFSKIIGQPAAPFSVHICSPEKTVNSKNWYDITIRPVPHQSESTYDIVTVFRNYEKSKVLKFVDNLEYICKNLIHIIEENP
jgi:hypothetical protein